MMEPNRIEHTVKISIVAVLVFATTLMVCGIGAYFYFARDLPSIEALRNYRPSTITKLFSEEGDLIAEYFTEKREVVSLHRIPDLLVQAFVAGEDARFFRHKGLDYLAILRALFKNIFSGEIVQGGSTITQQVVKSLLLSPEKSVGRKIREAILAYRIERHLTKEEILSLYLNQIYLGHGAYGVAVAAEVYFGKPVDELNLAEAALLAGLPQAPSKYSPYGHPDQARRRQIYVLNRMLEEGFISMHDLVKAAQTPLKFGTQQNSYHEKAPHFAEHVKRYIEEKYGKDALFKGGLQVYTTLDPGMQKVAQEAVESGLAEMEKRQKYPASEVSSSPEGALICCDLETGYVKAMVGGRDFRKSQFNRAVQARRQTGSAFKPIVYASALDKGYTPVSIVVDSPLVFEWGDRKWKPKNFEGKFSGPITVRSALTRSVNVATVKIAQDVGIDYIREYARKLGISSSLADDLSMALGSSSLSLYELTKAYAVFANQGKAFRPIFVKKVLDRDGNLLEENLPPYHNQRSEVRDQRSEVRDQRSEVRGQKSEVRGQNVEIKSENSEQLEENSRKKAESSTQSEESGPQPSEVGPDGDQIVSPQTAYLMTHLLQGVVQNGTGWRAKSLGRPVAAKTGTTDQFFDAWFIGYTPELVTGVWVGFDGERSLGEDETGARAASPIWVNFMTKALKERPIKDFQIPEGIEFMRIEARTGHPSSKKEAILECFREGTAPSSKVSVQPRAHTDFFKFDLNFSARTR